MKSKMGRPRLPKGEARGVYPLRLSKGEIAMFEKAAKKAEMKLPEWIRSVLTETASKIT